MKMLSLVTAVFQEPRAVSSLWLEPEWEVMAGRK